MEEIKYSSYRDESHDFESVGEEYDGLVSGIRRPAAVKKYTRITRLIPLLLVASFGLNICQMVYIAVHRPQFLSLYGKYNQEKSGSKSVIHV